MNDEDFTTINNKLLNMQLCIKEVVMDDDVESNYFLKLDFLETFTDNSSKNISNDAKKDFLRTYKHKKNWWFHPDEAPLWQLEPNDLLELKLWKHKDNIYVIHPHSLIIYHINGESICRWGDSGHATEGHKFPDELKPTCVECSSMETTWTTNPYTKEVHGESVYGWWCDECYRQNANEI